MEHYTTNSIRLNDPCDKADRSSPGSNSSFLVERGLVLVIRSCLDTSRARERERERERERRQDRKREGVRERKGGKERRRGRTAP